jgi:activator of HSP90 ATPase
MKKRTIKQTVIIKAEPHEVYEALMDSEKHAGFSGAKAKISRKVGGKFKCYDGWIDGWNVELVHDEKIVQKWRGANWPEGHYSTVTFALNKRVDGTRLSFTQTDVPEDHYESISKGWYESYWDKMKPALEAR